MIGPGVILPYWVGGYAGWWIVRDDRHQGKGIRYDS